MPDLSFAVTDAQADTAAAAPLVNLELQIANGPAAERIESIVLRCQVLIEATRRRYTPDEQARLVDLFGEPDRWSQTLGRLLWTHATTAVGSFAGQTTATLSVPCTFDFNVAATKYFAGLSEGEVPLLLQFSGSVFYNGANGLQVALIPWDRETRFRLPVQVWRDMMERHYPNSAWLRLRRDAFDRLQAYKQLRGIPTWEQTIESLLATMAEQSQRNQGLSA